MVVHDRTRLIGPLFLFLFCFNTASSAEAPSEHKSLADEAFVVETTDEDAAASLDRISGHIDLGLATPDQVYKSSNHGAAGPLASVADHDRSPDY